MHLDCAGHCLDLDRPRCMGILNVTPDSFYDGGEHELLDRAVRRAWEMVEQGADIIDVGGESTRPGAPRVSVEEEIARVVPVLEALRDLPVPRSIDTSKGAVMKAAADAGAGLINDVWALRRPGALAAAAATGLPVCLMHMQGEPGTMQQAPHYDDVVGDVHDFLRDRLIAVSEAGIDRAAILIDPGFGFGKTLDHNLALLARISEFCDLAPVLVGVSRKSMFGALLDRPPDERLAASVAAAVILVERGATLVRAHDVAETADALNLVAAVRAVHEPPTGVS